MNFLSTLKSIFKLKDLRKRIIIVLILVVIARIFAAIPIPGIDKEQIANYFNNNEAFSLLNIFTGGGLENFSLALMGVGPYITASIIFQLLVVVIPRLEEMQKESEAGRKKINQLTRTATVPLSFLQSFGTITLLKQQQVISNITTYDFILMLVFSTAGTMILMWLGELISEQGIGNGLSIIITIGILSAIPSQIAQTAQSYISGDLKFILGIIGFLIIAVLILVVIIYISEGVRKIPISYTRHIRGGGFGNVGNHLPIKVNAAGVIPIIFAISLIVFPPVIAQFFENAKSAFIADSAVFIKNLFENQIFYGVMYFVLVFGFTFFYTFIIFKPDQIAENLQKQGGFIPGIRPGKETEDYLYIVINRLTLAGAIFLGIIAVLPIVVQNVTDISTLKLGGTSLLIIVSVTLETIRQIRAQIISRTYELS